MPDFFVYIAIIVFAIVICGLTIEQDDIQSFFALLINFCVEIPLIIWLTYALSQPIQLAYDCTVPVFTENQAQYIKYKDKKINVNIKMGKVFKDGDLIRVRRDYEKYAGIVFVSMAVREDSFEEVTSTIKGE